MPLAGFYPYHKNNNLILVHVCRDIQSRQTFFSTPFVFFLFFPLYCTQSLLAVPRPQTPGKNLQRRKPHEIHEAYALVRLY
jgi:hypothetical protein